MSVFDQLAGQEDVASQLRTAAQAARRMLAELEAVESGQDSLLGALEDTLEDTAEGEAAADLAEAIDRAGSEMTHAWLFTGPPGSGRSVAARCFAAALQCDDPTEPGCGECETCRDVMNDRHPDVMVVQPEGLTIQVKEIRSIVSRASTFPATGNWQIVIVEDADRLTEQAGNALLKAVEEPPSRTVFILCAPSDDPQDIMVTLRSRTRHVYVRMPTRKDVADLLLREGATPEQAEWSAAVADAHIGRARVLLHSEEARARRRKVLELGQLTNHPSRAYNAAVQVVQDARKAAADANKEMSEKETEELRTALGAGGTGKGAGTAMRGTAGALKELKDSQKRRETRMVRDSVDLSLTDLAAFYRDALVQATGAKVDLIHVDAHSITKAFADFFSPESLLQCIDAVMAARTEINQNVKPEMAVGGMVGAISEALNAGRLQR
ncbi:MAG: DNA polymerase III subunit delta' [Lawsonella sp.]